MTYELAQQLKEAGFPQEKSYFVYVGKEKISREDAPRSNDYGEQIDIPTLSELIEACGMPFSLYVGVRDNTGQKITTRSVAQSPAFGLVVEGSTPEEAVARLWLSLNKKSDTL